MLDKGFNKNIKNVINKIAFPVYIIHLYPTVSCICNSTNSNEGKKTCPLCLGTGKKIKIRVLDAAMEPEEQSTARWNSGSQKAKSVMNMYYINYDVIKSKMGTDDIYSGDMFVRNDEVDIVNNVKKYRSDSNTPIYYIVGTSQKRNDLEIFLDLFHKVVDDR